MCRVVNALRTSLRSLDRRLDSDKYNTNSSPLGLAFQCLGDIAVGNRCTRSFTRCRLCVLDGVRKINRKPTDRREGKKSKGIHQASPSSHAPQTDSQAAFKFIHLRRPLRSQLPMPSRQATSRVPKKVSFYLAEQPDSRFRHLWFIGRNDNHVSYNGV